MQLVPHAPSIPTSAPIPDDQLVQIWLHGRGPHTRRAYARDVQRFRDFVGVPLAQVRLGDLQAFADELETQAPASRARTLSAVKSLLAFGHRLGYLPYDVGAALKLPTLRNRLAERILDEPTVHRLLALEPTLRNRVLLRLAYAGGLRAAELCGLKWRDLQPRDEAGQVTIYGKGEKTRTILLSAATWAELQGLRGDAGDDDPVFRSQKGGHLDESQIWRIVRAAARRVGLETAVSPHWLRHAHASHALDRGCPIHLVQATLGHASVATTGKYLHARPTDSSSRYLAV
jgi:integrase/recombinase XerD